MGEIFLGKRSHWLLLILLAALLYGVGTTKLHVIHFNLFVTSLLGLAIVLVVALRLTSGANERITRDPLSPPGDRDS